MNKKIIALAVASAFAAPMAAQAEMKVYGQGQIEYGTWGGNDGASIGNESIEDNARGRLGFKSTEDLGNGLKAIAKFEFKVDTSDGDADTKSKTGNISLQKREMMIGLKGGWGQFQAGRLKTAYKYTGGVKYDPFVASILEARGNAGMSGKVGNGAIKSAAGHNGFVDDSVAYINKFGNIHFWITYDLDTGGPSNGSGGSNAITAALKYKSKKWEMFVAMVDDDGGDAAPGNGYDSIKFGGQVKIGAAHKISAQYEQATDEANGFDIDTYYVDYQFKFGKNMIDLAIGNTDVSPIGGGASADGDFLRIALKHKFSKKTSTWIGYRANDTDVNEDIDVISLGMRVDF
ncbi:MAG: porin [Thiohalomonadales bacterium]